jgi:hypothetical protein
MDEFLTIVTDIPVWVRPLKRALEALKVRVETVTEPGAEIAGSTVVNRISALIRQRDPQKTAAFAGRLRELASEGRIVINGADCFELGCSKLAQGVLFERAGVRTPRTRPAVPGGRAIPGSPVLLKPPAGGYGRGIVRLEDQEPAPADLFRKADGWIEQEVVPAADQAVHRIEVLGEEILYEARSPVRPGDYNYCLADPDSDTVLVPASGIRPEIVQAALRVTQSAQMEIGGVEYLLGADGHPVFIDLNPVSSLHPGAGELLGKDPVELTAAYLRGRALGEREVFGGT